MKKLFLMIMTCANFLWAETLILKEGWNLIGIPSTDSVTILETNSEIEKATGGGVGNTNSFVYLKDSFSRGSFLLGQAYWIKSSSDTSLEYTSSITPSSITLSEGWNLIYPFSTISAESLADYPEIEKATGGGVGNTNSFVYLKDVFSRGETLENQGYWIKASSSFDMIFEMFDYRAWGIGGDDISSKANIRINGIPYTVFIYSTLDILQSNASSSGDFTLFTGSSLGKTVPAIQINADYTDQNVKLKFFASDSVFDDTTLVYESDPLVANASLVEYGNLVFANPDDYSVPQPTDSNPELLPPASPTF